MKNKIKNKSFLLLVLLLVSLQNSLHAQSRESLIKAGFIEKFTHFVEWPDIMADSDSSNTFVIKIIGKSLIGNALEDLFNSVSIKGMEVKIEYISSEEEIGSCRILFISGSESGNLSEILKYTTGKPILTIGDTKGFGEKGVLINLFNEGNYIRYEVNKTGIEKSGLEINSLLLSYAVIIESNG